MTPQRPSIKSRPYYLGDGLYASFDGYQIRLYADRESITHEVFLDTDTLAAFLVYARNLQEEA